MPAGSGPLGEVPGLVWDEKRQRYFRSKGPGRPASAASESQSSSQNAGNGALREEPLVQEVPVDQAVMQSLREISFNIKRLRSSNKKQIQQSECSVCLEALEQGERVLELPCKHLFHKHCLKPWMQQRGSCPSCRAPVDVALSAAQAAACFTRRT